MSERAQRKAEALILSMYRALEDGAVTVADRNFSWLWRKTAEEYLGSEPRLVEDLVEGANLQEGDCSEKGE